MDNSIREKITESFFVISEIGVNLFHYDYVYESSVQCELMQSGRYRSLSVPFGHFRPVFGQINPIKINQAKTYRIYKFDKIFKILYLQTLTQTFVVH